MTEVDGIILAALIAAFTSFAVSVGYDAVKTYFQLRTQKRAEERQFLQIQLAEFYDPIFTLLTINERVFKSTGPTSVKRTDSLEVSEEKKMLWDELVIKVIIPNNQRICGIIENKLHLLSPEDDVNIYMRFSVHSHAYTVFKQEVFSTYRDFGFPSEIVEHVSKHRQNLYNRLERK